MLPFTQSTKMPLLLLLWALTAMTAAQPRCDPLTQYEKNGQCCNMCNPGSSMSSLSTCLEPQCKDCGMNEYQEKYTSESKCQRQPYCDPNLNFQTPVHESKKRSICKCKVGFHCSPNGCLTCVQHNPCTPGHWAQSTGNDMNDTVCQKCPEGTFSNEISLDGVCKKWTECGYGRRIEQSGTDTSDNICEETSRTHIIVIIVMIAVCLIAVVLAFLFWLCKGKLGDAKGKVKGCVETCLGNKNEPVKLLTITPNDPDDEESTLNEVQSSQEEGLRSPVESDYPSSEMLTDIQNRQAEGITDNGNFVAQENGKTERLSRQESQTQTF